MDVDQNVKVFCAILNQLPIFYEVGKCKGDVVVEITSIYNTTAQVDFQQNGQILAIIDLPDSNYFHAWEILPSKEDFQYSAKKIVSTLNDETLRIDNRMANACCEVR